MLLSRWAPLIILILITYVNSVEAKLKISGGLGFGSSSTKNEVTAVEGPLTQFFTLEDLGHSKISYGAEHLRSVDLAGLSSAIYFTGFFVNYYLNSAPVPYLRPDELKGESVTVRDICYFVGAGLGYANSNLLPDKNNKSSNAALVYLSPRAGFDLQLTQRFGFREQLVIGMGVFGKGAISSFSLVSSIYWSF